ncbi:unnamed protein product [Caenorhabditis sp. 36 PRJEB53466]|nr:unnamed protein product [Caenorhabditis sp. 36 PRJEB53466]
MAGCPLYDESLIISASLSFALEFETPKEAKHTILFKVEKAPSECERTVDEDPEMPTQMTAVQESEGPKVMTMIGPAMETPEQAMAVPESESLYEEPFPDLRQISSRLLFKRRVERSQPVLAQESSEVEERRNEKKKRETLVKARETRKFRKDIEKALTSTLYAFGQVASAKSRTGSTLTESWKEMNRITCNWLVMLHERKALRQSTFHAFFLNAEIALRKTMNAARPRPPETHVLMLRFVVDFSKIYEIAQLRNIKEVLGCLSRLLEIVLGKHLGDPKRMSSTHMPWIQTKEVIRLLLSAINRTETIYGLLQLMSRIQSYFISKWAVRRDRNDEFIAFAVAQLQDFSSILSRKLEQLATENVYLI